MTTTKSRNAIRMTLNDLREIRDTIEYVLANDDEMEDGRASSQLMGALNNAFDANSKIRPYYNDDSDSSNVDTQFTTFIGRLARATNIQNEVVESETIVDEDIDLSLQTPVNGLRQRKTDQLQQTHTELVKLITLLHTELGEDPPSDLPDADAE